MRYFIVTCGKLMSGHLTGIITTKENFPNRREIMTKMADMFGNHIGDFIAISEISEDDYNSLDGSF
jgi:hypothetical protein